MVSFAELYGQFRRYDNMSTHNHSAKLLRGVTMKNLKQIYLCSFLLAGFAAHAEEAIDSQVIAPPALGEETKGTPVALELNSVSTEGETSADDSTEQETVKSLFGKSKITESKRENGQVYLIELEHSSGSKQYIEENDSDGKIQSTSNDIEETPNLPKWKLGSW